MSDILIIGSFLLGILLFNGFTEGGVQEVQVNYPVVMCYEMLNTNEIKASITRIEYAAYILTDENTTVIEASYFDIPDPNYRQEVVDAMIQSEIEKYLTSKKEYASITWITKQVELCKIATKEENFVDLKNQIQEEQSKYAEQKNTTITLNSSKTPFINKTEVTALE